MIDGASYNLPPDLSENTNYKIKLSLLSAAGTFLNDYILEENKEYYIKDGNLFLRPNELLDRENYTEGNYTLQFDFITRYEDLSANTPDQPFYISEISPTRKEIRLSHFPVGDGVISTDIADFFNDGEGDYDFNSFLEISQGRLIPINAYTFDVVTGDTTSLILKLNNTVPSDVSVLSTNFFISCGRWQRRLSLLRQETSIFYA